jgi:hypothetical protein
MTRIAIAVLACGVATAHADTPLDEPSQIEVDRSETPVGRTEFGFDGGAPVEGWGATFGAGWLERPITFRAPDDTTTQPVRRRETLSIGGALALGTAVVVDGRFAIGHQIGDRLSALGDGAALERYVLGDLRIGARARVAGSDDAVFLRADLTLPSGNEQQFSGEPSWSVAWRLIGRATLPQGIVVAANAGIRFRGREVLVGDRLVGNEFIGAAGVAVPIPPIRPLWCVADQVKLTAELTGVLGDDVGTGRGPSPVEARAGLVTRPLPSVTIGVRVGAGLADQIGAPQFRATIEVTYQGAWKLIPPAEPDDPSEP